MPVKKNIPYNAGIFFITVTNYKWLPLIHQTNSYDLVYKWFDVLKQNGHFINGYVIMPNHVHALIGFRKTHQSINTIIGTGKRFMAYEIVQRLKNQREENLLEQLKLAVNRTDAKRNKLHEVWEDSFDWKHCDSQKFITQKLDYMHLNPCSGKWSLVEDPAAYIHSSAGYYLTGNQGIYPVTDYMQMEDIDLTGGLG